MQAMQGRIDELQGEVDRRFTREECNKMIDARVEGIIKETADLLNEQKREVCKVAELLGQSARRDDVIKALEGNCGAQGSRPLMPPGVPWVSELSRGREGDAKDAVPRDTVGCGSWAAASSKAPRD